MAYNVGVSEFTSEVLRIERAISLTCVLSAKFRNQVNVSQIEIDRLMRHIEALEGHISRVENHSKHLKNLNDSQIAKYEASLSWKISAPVRWAARAFKRILR